MRVPISRPINRPIQVTMRGSRAGGGTLSWTTRARCRSGGLPRFAYSLPSQAVTIVDEPAPIRVRKLLVVETVAVANDPDSVRVTTPEAPTAVHVEVETVAIANEPDEPRTTVHVAVPVEAIAAEPATPRTTILLTVETSAVADEPSGLAGAVSINVPTSAVAEEPATPRTSYSLNVPTYAVADEPATVRVSYPADVPTEAVTNEPDQVRYAYSVDVPSDAVAAEPASPRVSYSVDVPSDAIANDPDDVSLTTSTVYWTPADGASYTLELWLDAQDAATITKDGSNLVSAWNDKSGNDNHATQGTGARQPVYAATNTDLNNLPTISPVDAGDGMALVSPVSAATWLINGLNAPTYGIGIAEVYAIMPAMPVNGVFAAMFPTIPLTDANEIHYRDGFLQSNAADYAGTDPAATGAMFFAGRVKSDGLGNVYGRFIDSTGAIMNANTWDRTANKDFGEVIHVSGAITSDDRQRIEGYLAHKWGLEGNLDAAHPYKAAPPVRSLWTPDDLTSATIEFWLDAQDAATITKDGSDLVSGWDDKSSNARDASATSGAEPTYTASNANFNSKPTVGALYGGTRMTFAGVSLPEWTYDTEFFYDAAAHFAGLTSRGGALPGTPFNAIPALIFGSGTMASADNIHWLDGIQTTSVGDEGGGSYGSAGAMFAALRIKGAGFSTVYGRIVDGTTLFNRATGDRSGNMDLGELLFVLGTLTTDERQRLEGYLAHKWGLEGNLDAGHPYKAAPPYV